MSAQPSWFSRIKSLDKNKSVHSFWTQNWFSWTQASISEINVILTYNFTRDINNI